MNLCKETFSNIAIHKRELYESKLYIRRISSHKRY
ncbi:hypothetical protein RUMOBE_00478 [Blautia obeum ATCC 29174]|uniref:Uncharacterized protein n=1 Tax=Blautia obeum ATCC 29174 TaxID=411459 RepID=A5ZNB1_9FIRM|nr:hypothetical protein RUMOBE_00478 [Blautia obeum ATCC 29174]